MTRAPTGWHQPALVGWGLILGLVGGPLLVFSGVRLIDRGTALDMVAGWLMIVGGVLMVVGGGLTLFGLLRRKQSKYRPMSRKPASGTGGGAPDP